MDTFWEKQEQRVLTTNKPFQIAIGSTGEPTIHPEFCDFLKTVYESGVVPNYTTNGIILSKQTPLAEAILEATRKYVGGVAVSFGNEALREQARHAVVNLINNGNTNVNIHHIISDKESVDEFLAEWLRFEDKVLYHVLLPLMPAGRSDSGIEEGVWEYLEEMIQKHNIKNVAFGAHFIKYLRNSKIKTWLYDEESFSKNIILTPNKVQITPSSFDLNPIQIIDL
jgi:MoaA/NifB/PqqE/SkfB family radical SAM enzyme